MFRVYAFGNAPRDAIDIHDRLDEVNAALIDAVKPGVPASELYRLGRGEMERRGLELALDFVGHGLGIDVHERPYLVATDHTPLEPNMVGRARGVDPQVGPGPPLRGDHLPRDR